MGAGRGLGCVGRRHACGRARGRSLQPLSDHVAECRGAAGASVCREICARISRRIRGSAAPSGAPGSSLVATTSPASVCGGVTLVGALVLGSHAMYDSFAVIGWRGAGISPEAIGLLWSEAVGAVVLCV